MPVVLVLLLVMLDVPFQEVVTAPVAGIARHPRSCLRVRGPAPWAPWTPRSWTATRLESIIFVIHHITMITHVVYVVVLRVRDVYMSPHQVCVTQRLVPMGAVYA